MTYNLQKEVNEAVRAGEQSLSSLRRVLKSLDSARNWGVFDMFGGGGLTGLIKHARINDATSNMSQAKRDLQIFERELQDVVAYKDIKVEIDSFLIFADFFFDGFLADYLVQRKINQTRQEVEQAICHVERILSDLRRYN